MEVWRHRWKPIPLPHTMRYHPARKESGSKDGSIHSEFSVWDGSSLVPSVCHLILLLVHLRTVSPETRLCHLWRCDVSLCLQARWEYVAEQMDAVQSAWSFVIETLSLSIPFLCVGTTREPIIYLERPHLDVGELLVGMFGCSDR